MPVAERYAEVRRRIEEACKRSGRDPGDVRVIAVTKYVGLETTKEVLDSGIEHVGENRVQEALPKWERLGHRGVWHFIGHLQRNKVKDVVGKFAYIHSLDRLSLAEEIEKRAKRLGIVCKCFVQVNVSGEQSKYGLPPEEVVPFVRRVSEMEAIEVVGLMTMAPFVEDPQETRDVFRGLKALQREVQALSLPRVPAPHLSMGMSNDFEVAVEEGATFVRLGSILVGKEA
ncbi:YggS family pyridoxal phosphate-dependent enzyme [Bacillaceae bacterium]